MGNREGGSGIQYDDLFGIGVSRYEIALLAVKSVDCGSMLSATAVMEEISSAAVDLLRSMYIYSRKKYVGADYPLYDMLMTVDYDYHLGESGDLLDRLWELSRTFDDKCISHHACLTNVKTTGEMCRHLETVELLLKYAAEKMGLVTLHTPASSVSEGGRVQRAGPRLSRIKLE